MIFDWFKTVASLNTISEYFRRGIKFCILCFVASPALAENLSTTFKVEPSICMALSAESSCQMTISVHWEIKAEEKNDICLKLDKTELQCWQAITQGTFYGEVTLIKDTEIALVNKETTALLAQQAITIRYVHPKNFRRRLRADWSIF